MKNRPFVHLRVHSEYALVDSVIRIYDLLEKTQQFQLPALAITDHNNLFATVKFYKAALAQGIKPIIGADLLMVEDTQPNTVFLISLLCQNLQGFRALSRLLSRAYTEGQSLATPKILRSWLTPESCEGLIALQNYQKLLH